MFLMGYGPQILAGTWETIKLAVLSVTVSVVLGLVAASCKVFPTSRVLRSIATLYTTIIRGIPDLVLLMLVFFTLQEFINTITDHLTELSELMLDSSLTWLHPAASWVDIGYVDLSAFTTGVITLGFIYGAYFAETFRGAFLAVPAGQLEAAKAYGMKPWSSFRRVLFPQMLRHALPGLGNNWQVLLKATALVSLVGLNDMVKVAQNAGAVTHHPFTFMVTVGVIYLALTTLSNGVLYALHRRYGVGVARPQL